MKNITLVSTLIGSLAATGTATANIGTTHANLVAPVSIASPVDGSTVSNRFNTSFKVNCPAGQNSVKWFVDGLPVGNTPFYDTADIKFAYKLASGMVYSLKVTTSCGGSNAIVFKVQ